MLPTQENPIRPKVAAGGIASSVTVILLALATMLGWEIPEGMVEEAVIGFSAVVALVQFLAAYMKKDNLSKKVKGTKNA